MKVRVITASEQVALVEYVTEGQRYGRVVVPARTVAGDSCPDEVVAQGIPYGADWSALIQAADVSEHAANELRRRGLWNVKDVLARPDEAKSAFISVAAGLLAQLLRTVRTEE